MAMKTAVRRHLDRRTFFKSAGAAAAGASAFGLLTEADVEGAVQNVNRNSVPSELKITDLRVATVVGAPMICPLIRIDTNQGLYGYGEVRDGASATYALILKSRLLGENPCNVDKLFRKIKQFGAPARQAGGVCGVEMALWDLAGKAYGVPVLPDARRQVPRQGAPLRRHDGDRGPKGAGPQAQGAHGPGLHVAEAGFRHQPAEGRPRGAHEAARRRVHRPRLRDAPVHRHLDHREGRRLALRLGRGDSRGDRVGGAARLGPLRPHRRELVHPPGARWRSTTWRGWRTWCPGSSDADEADHATPRTSRS